MQELEASSSDLSNILTSGGFYVIALMVLAFFANSLIAAGAAVAYVDSRGEMQSKKNQELGRILDSAEEGPDIRAMMRERSKGQAVVTAGPKAESDAIPDIQDETEDERPAIRPATPDDNVEDDFSPMILEKLDEDEPKLTSDASNSVLNLENLENAPLSLKPDDHSPKETLQLNPEDAADKAQKGNSGCSWATQPCDQPSSQMILWT